MQIVKRRIFTIACVCILLCSVNFLSFTVLAVLPEPPEISSPSPSSGENGVSTSLAQVSITITDMDEDGFANELAWSIEVSNGDSSSGSSETSGTKTCAITGALSSSTVYTWWINATTDAQGSALGPTNSSYSFTTESNTAPTITALKVYNATLGTNESLNSTNISILPTNFWLTIADADVENLRYMLRTNESGAWVTKADVGPVAEGTKNITSTDWIDTWNTTYYVSINVSDYTVWTNETFTILTRTTPLMSLANVDPTSGTDEDTYEFNVTITDLDNDSQLVYADIRALGGATLKNVSMSWVSGDNVTGAVYNLSTTITVAGAYVCDFVSYDGLSWALLTSGVIQVASSAQFQISFPPYLEVGQYILAEGSLRNATGVPLNAVWVNTTILDSSWAEIADANMSRYVVDGYYSYTFSTSSMIPGVYWIIVNFSADSTYYVLNSTLYLSDSSGSGHYAATLYFRCYNYNTGIGLDTNAFKIYADDSLPLTAADRLYHDNSYQNTYTGATVYYRVDDYFNNQVYPSVGTYATTTVANTATVEDVPVDWNSFSVKNMNHNIVYFNITSTTGGTSYRQYLYPYEPFYWNILDGVYTINLTYYNPATGAFISYSEENVTVTDDAYYWISGYSINDVFMQGEDLINRSVLVFNFYNTNEGIGFQRELLQVYVNGTRHTADEYNSEIGASLNITVRDYYNTTMFQQNYTVTGNYHCLDLGLTFHSWLFGNKNDNAYMISLLRLNASRWWERGIIAGGEREFLIPSGNYTLRIYDADLNEIYNQSHIVNRSMLYAIEGTNLSEIIAGLSVIRGQLLELGGTLDYALMPDDIIWARNPVCIFSVFDRLGQELGTNVWKVCPPLNVVAKTRNSTISANVTSYPLIPTNGTAANGTISIVEDTLYMSGNTSVTYVNITYADNGTLIQNTTYVQNKIDLLGENITIVSDVAVYMQRETVYSQTTKFYWNIYNTTINDGHIPGRGGYHSTGLEVINVLNTPLVEVYVYAGFSDKTIPDYNTVRVTDEDNGLVLESGEDFKVGGAIEFKIDGGMTALETREFTVGYYKDVAHEYYYDDALVTVYSYETQKTLSIYDDLFNRAEFMYVNGRSLTFTGSIKVKLDFPLEVDTDNVKVFDLDNNQEVSEDYLIVSDEYVWISSAAVGAVSGGGTRSYALYFTEIEFPGLSLDVYHLNTPLVIIGGLEITAFMIIVIVCILISSAGALLTIKKKKAKDSYTLMMILGLTLIFVFWILQSKGV